MHLKSPPYTAVLLGIVCTLLAGPALGQDLLPAREDVAPPKSEYSPYADDHFPNRVFFGDTHLHTSWSTDAGMAGATLGPDAAYLVGFFNRNREETIELPVGELNRFSPGPDDRGNRPTSLLDGAGGC